MDKLLFGQKGIITGGTRGIGYAICLAFAKAGASFAFTGRDSQRGDDVVRELSLINPEGEYLFIKADFEKSEQIVAAAASYFEKWSEIDFLVNNAGLTRDKLLMQMKQEEWDLVIHVNLSSLYTMTHEIIRPMIRKKQGSIINISSVVAITGNAGQTNYCAAKGGVVGLTRALAKEVASRGIRVNAIAPGFIETDMTAVLNEEQRAHILKQIPMGRMGRAEEIAEAALFLASPMSRYMTGTLMAVDGGMTTY